MHVCLLAWLKKKSEFICAQFNSIDKYDGEHFTEKKGGLSDQMKGIAW